MTAATALLAEAEAAGVTLQARLWADHPDRLPHNLRVQLREHQAEVLALLLAPANNAPAVQSVPTQQVSNPDPDAEAERAAIMAEPALPAPGSPERGRADTEQREAVGGLLRAALGRPPSWADVNAMPGKMATMDVMRPPTTRAIR